MGWKLLTTPPKKSGRYIVAHRGHSEIIHYLAPEEKGWYRGAKLGWQKDPRAFGATYYMPLREVTLEEGAIADADLTARGLFRIVEGLRPKSKYPKPPTKWALFLALIGKKELSPYPAIQLKNLAPFVDGDDSDPRYIITIAK